MAVAGVLIIILLTLRLVALFVSVRKRRRNKTHNVTGAGEAIEMGVACAPTLLNPAVTSTTRDNRVSLVEENIYEDMSGDLTEEGCSVVRMDSTKKHSTPPEDALYESLDDHKPTATSTSQNVTMELAIGHYELDLPVKEVTIPPEPTQHPYELDNPHRDTQPVGSGGHNGDPPQAGSYKIDQPLEDAVTNTKDAPKAGLERTPKSTATSTSLAGLYELDPLTDSQPQKAAASLTVPTKTGLDGHPQDSKQVEPKADESQGLYELDRPIEVSLTTPSAVNPSYNSESAEDVHITENVAYGSFHA